MGSAVAKGPGDPFDIGSALSSSAPAAAAVASRNARTSRLMAQVLSAPIGKILVHSDTVMQVGVPSSIVVRIDQRVGEQIRQRLTPSGATVVDTVRITTIMSVDVHGPNFRVARVPSSAKPEQLVLPDQFTEWRFEVTPEASGVDTLFVLAAARFTDGTVDEPRYYPVTTLSVRVRVNYTYAATEFMRTYWAWLVGTPMLPLFGWFARRRGHGTLPPHSGPKPPRPGSSVPQQSGAPQNTA